ncbi:MAG: transposase [Deltaproteobacteria bacterium]|nr:transposase [Deltaproteobacteria bacterium]
MKKYLRRLGYKVSRKRIQRLMRLMGLSPITSVQDTGRSLLGYVLKPGRQHDENGKPGCPRLA